MEMMFPLHCMERHGNFPKIQQQCDLLSSTDGEISEFSGPSFQKMGLFSFGTVELGGRRGKDGFGTLTLIGHILLGGRKFRKKCTLVSRMDQKNTSQH